MNETHRVPERSQAALAPDLQSTSTDNDVPSYAFGQGIMRLCRLTLRFVHSASKANQPLCRLLHFATASRLSTNWPDRAHDHSMNVVQKDIFMDRATAITLSNRRCCALLTKTSSNVPSYADELVFVKSNLIFRRLPACRQVCLHAEALRN